MYIIHFINLYYALFAFCQYKYEYFYNIFFIVLYSKMPFAFPYILLYDDIKINLYRLFKSYIDRM